MSQNFAFLNQQGFIPGPHETEEDFYQRVQFCENLLFHLKQDPETAFPFEDIDTASQSISKEAFDLTKKFYGIHPDWVPLFFSNHQLAPWHGGCAWIFQLNETTPLAAFLQLRAHFRHSSTYLGFYHRKELIAHELAHVGRLMLNDPQFEEFFAYQSSSYSWRRWLGPLIQSSTESLIFILLLGLIFLVDLATLSLNHPTLLLITGWLKLAPLILIGLALIRLIKRHLILQRCLKKLTCLTTDSTQAAHLLYRLQDKEISQFAKKSIDSIKEYISHQIPHSFRWRFLSKIYINDFN